MNTAVDTPNVGNSGPIPPSPFGRWLAYLYFCRFGVILWASMLAFAAADKWTSVAVGSRGIVALENGGQFFWATFVIVIAGWVALLSARIICAYGEERFGVPPPPIFTIGETMSYKVFLAAQIPGACLLGYVLFRSLGEGYPSTLLALCLMTLGALVAVVCWYLLAAFYYWTYETDAYLINEGRMSRHDGERRLLLRQRAQLGAPGTGIEAKAFLAPIGKCPWFLRLQNDPPPAISRLFDRAFSIVARLGAGFSKSGTTPGDMTPINSGQALAIITLAFLVFVYGVLYYYTAPIPMPVTRRVTASIVVVIVLGWSLLAYRYWRRTVADKQIPIAQYVVRAMLLLLPVWLLDGLVLSGWQTHHGFPVLATVYLLLIFVCWGFAGLAFLLDRFRVPVLLSVVAFVAFVNTANSWIRMDDDHLFPTYPKAADAADPIQPAAVLSRYAATHAGFSGKSTMIIVTAEGGGIHSAAWTSLVLSKLEQKFADKNLDFHNSILLMSSVSGGSIAVEAWMREYLNTRSRDQAHTFAASSLAIHAASGCSSLEAVAWGLLYPDFAHLIAPLRWAQEWDRGRSLELATERNLKDKDCDTNTYDFTGYENLGALADGLARNPVWIPAVTFNATTEEAGERFLFSNYVLPPPITTGSETKYPPVRYADSFFSLYSGRDLSLSTAARLSATFPYVTPMSRIERSVMDHAYHFGDGGYFDNQGVVSAIEFLYASLNGSKGQQPSPSAPPAIPQPMHILFLEIHNDEDAKEQLPDPRQQVLTEDSSWGPLAQGLAPLGAMLNSRSGGQIIRNCRELQLLRYAFGNKADSPFAFRTIIFDYHRSTSSTISKQAQRLEVDPLSWHLTLGEKNDIEQAWNQESETRADEAIQWFGDHAESSSQTEACGIEQ
jgi:hypothetical protein